MPDVSVPVITVDGPSGVGKGAIAYRLADGLGFHLLDHVHEWFSGPLRRLNNIEIFQYRLALHFHGKHATPFS